MTNRRPIPIASPSARRTRAPSAWNVPATTSRPPSPTRLMIRSRSSAAARLVKVTARIRHGATSLTLDQVGDPVGQDPGLAGAGAGQDEQRTLGRRDGAGLLRVERADDLLLARLERRRAGGRVRRRGAGARVLGLGRRLAHPDRLVRDGARGLGQVGEDGPGGGRRGVVQRGVAGPAASGGTHRSIVGRATHPAVMGGQEAGLTWSGGGAAMETGSSHFEARRSAVMAVPFGAVSVASMPARW